MDIKKLIAVATGEIAHTNNGLCPDMVAGYDSRDPYCLACQIIMETERNKQEPALYVQSNHFAQAKFSPFLARVCQQPIEGIATLPFYAAHPVTSEVVNKAFADGKAEGHGDATAEASVVIGELRARVATLEADLKEMEKQSPVFWYRPLRHAGMYEGPLHHNSPEGQFRRDEEPGEWVPLYAGQAHEASSNTYTMPDGVGGAKWAGLRAQGYRAIGLVLQNDHGETCSVTEHGRVMWDRKMAHPGYDHPDHALELVGLRGCAGGAERGEDQAAEAGGGK